jgi:hypothetical protein
VVGTELKEALELTADGFTFGIEPLSSAFVLARTVERKYAS